MSVFSNMPGDSSLDYSLFQDPNNTAQSNLPGESPMVGPGGKTKIVSTDLSGESGKPMHTSNDASMQSQGMAPSGENSSGIPAAQPIKVMTFGDPNDTALDFKDGMDPNNVSPTGADIARYGFKGPV